MGGSERLVQGVATVYALTFRSGFSALLTPLWPQYTPLDWASGNPAFAIYDLHWHLGARELHPSMPFPGMLHSPSSFEVYRPLLAGISRVCTGEIQHSW